MFVFTLKNIVSCILFIAKCVLLSIDVEPPTGLSTNMSQWERVDRLHRCIPLLKVK